MTNITKSEIIDLLEQELLTPGVRLVDEETGLIITVLEPNRLQLECGEVCETWRRSTFLEPTMLDQ